MESQSRVDRPAVFLDRDGTVNVEVHYLSRPEQVELLPTVAETIAILNARQIPVIVVTNQAGIGRGYFPEEQLGAIHERLNGMLASQNAHIDGIYYCPHHPSEGLGKYKATCRCRKPLPGMLELAAREHGIDLARSLMIGDRESDLQAGTNAGCRSALVRTGYGQETSAMVDLRKVNAIGVFDTIAAAVAAWLD